MKKRSHLACQLILAIMIGPATAAAQVVDVGPNVTVLSAPSGAAIVEPHLAAHPTVPGHLVGAAMVLDTANAPSDRTYCAALLSTDGGATWNASRYPLGNCADPWLAITGSGEAVFSALGMHSALGVPDQMGLLIARSQDGGLVWSDTILGLGRDHDRSTMVADPRPESPRSLVIFSGQGVRVGDDPVRWSVYVARSVNAGRSFRLPVNLIPATST